MKKSNRGLPISKVHQAISLWDHMSIEDRIAFVKYLSADSSVALYTESEVEARIADMKIRPTIAVAKDRVY